MKNVIVSLIAISVMALGAAPLPQPDLKIPENPPLPPAVITCSGKRLLLSRVAPQIKVEYRNGVLLCQPAGWRLINYPLDRIAGFADAQTAAQTLFGVPAAKVKNYFFYTSGTSPEPPETDYPAALELTSSPTLKVPGQCKAIGEALKKAKTGDVITVAPGVYRESIAIPEGVTLEGIPDKDGRLPVISGDEPFKPDAFKAVGNGIWRADMPGTQNGRISCGGEVLREVGSLDELTDGRFFLNRSGRRFAGRGVSEQQQWRKITANKDGMLELGERGNAVYYGMLWIYAPPKKRAGATVWDPRHPEPITGRLDTGGKFRIARQTGSSDGSQVNRYRMRVNGAYVPVFFEPGKPVASLNYGKSERIEGFVLKEGWNELFLEFDTCTLPNERQFKFGIPRGIDGYYATAERPADLNAAPRDACNMKFAPEMLIAGPFETEIDRGVYVKLKGDADPNTQLMEIGVRGSLVTLDKPFSKLRGFELRGGSLYQQRAQVSVSGAGARVEGCFFNHPEVRGVTVNLSGMDQNSEPITVFNNFILNPGGVGVGASGSSEKLTADNQNSVAPGRGRMIIEYNTVSGNNRNGYNRYWESGSFKFFRLSGCIIRYNHFKGGFGPGLWMDWEHYGNRIEGNLAESVNSFGIGIEASPGANLVCNNSIVNTMPGEVWFRFGILAWSSNRVWAVNNTVDGRNNPASAWKKLTGCGGIYLSEGPLNRRTAWGETPKNAAAVNNALSGNRPDLHGDFIVKGGNNEPPVKPSPEMAVTQDFYGLPRVKAEIGAFRSLQQFNLEIEFKDGRIVQK